MAMTVVTVATIPEGILRTKIMTQAGRVALEIKMAAHTARVA